MPLDIINELKKHYIYNIKKIEKLWPEHSTITP